jgi:hypothetical protein
VTFTTPGTKTLSFYAQSFMPDPEGQHRIDNTVAEPYGSSAGQDFAIDVSES